MKNVCFLFGINGVGKSTLAAEIARLVVGAVHISGSEMLRRAFGGVSREALERMDGRLKRDMKRDALLGAFDHCASAPLVVCDTHLVVPIRECGSVRHEQMWDEAYLSWGTAFCNIVAPCAAVTERRRSDAIATGRQRSLDADAVALGARANDASFRRVFRGMPNAHVVQNVGSVREVALHVTRMLGI